MGQQEKKAAKQIIKDARSVARGESELLRAWSNDPAVSTGMQARCLKRANRIRDTSVARADAVLAEANATPAGAFVSLPSAGHLLQLDALQQSLANRMQVDPGEFATNPGLLTVELNDAQQNARSAADLAAAVLRDTQVADDG